MRSPAVLPCRVQPSTARLCPCVPLRARIVQEITDSGRPPLNQCNKRSQSIVNLIALLRAESAAFLYQVLTNRLMCGFYTLRKFLEIKFDHSSVVQILPSGVGHGGLPCRCARKRGEFQGYCASAVATLAQVAILAFHKVFPDSGVFLALNHIELSRCTDK